MHHFVCSLVSRTLWACASARRGCTAENALASSNAASKRSAWAAVPESDPSGGRGSGAPLLTLVVGLTSIWWSSTFGDGPRLQYLQLGFHYDRLAFTPRPTRPHSHQFRCRLFKEFRRLKLIIPHRGGEVRTTGAGCGMGSIERPSDRPAAVKTTH